METKIYKTNNHTHTALKKKEPKEHHYTATLRCTSPHFTQLHFTTRIDTSLPHIYTSLPTHLSWRILISYRSKSHFLPL